MNLQFIGKHIKWLDETENLDKIDYGIGALNGRKLLKGEILVKTLRQQKTK